MEYFILTESIRTRRNIHEWQADVALLLRGGPAKNAPQKVSPNGLFTEVSNRVN